MQTLTRTNAPKLWSQYWDEMVNEWFKIEVLQDYSGENDSPSLRAWLSGDKEESLKLLQQTGHHGWSEQCQHKFNEGALMHRIRILKKPHTSYTKWELEFYKYINIPNGEQVFVNDDEFVSNISLPTGDLMMFDNERSVICAYDSSGRVTQQIFNERGDDIAPFLELKHKLLPLCHLL